MRLRLLLLTALAAGGCATAAGPLPTPAPAEIPQLESQVASDPGDVDAGLRLAAAYRGNGQLDESRALVDRLVADHPDDAGLLAMSGLLAEDAGDLEAARLAYQAVLDGGRGGALLEEVERRLEVVRRAELRARVRDALEREDEVAQTDPDPSTVGIFPFLYEGADPEWEPLALALPEMLSTDLAVTGRLQVLERVHVQALLDEMALSASGRVDEETAVRSGRLLGSGNIVQGRFRIQDGARIGVDAAVVEVGEPGQDQVDPLSAEDAIERLFALEKQLALDLHEEMGIQLTPAERERVSERQTESVQALLEFGRGIAAEDAGDFAQAQVHFQAASSIDPGFALAQAHGRAAARLATIAPGDAGAQLLGAARRLASQRDGIRRILDAPASVRQRLLRSLADQRRAILAEVLGQDRLGQTVLLELIFRAPGGGP